MSSVLRNRRQHVDGHRLRVGLARKLQQPSVIDLVDDRLAGLDRFVEARGRIGGLVRERDDDFAGALVGYVVGDGVLRFSVEADTLQRFHGLGLRKASGESGESGGDDDGLERVHSGVPSDPVVHPEVGV
jgi:hypothetical protein